MTSVEKIRLLELKREQAVRRARKSMFDFTLYTNSEYMPNWHHRLLCSYLDRFVAGEITRLMVFMPPRHGKSELVSRRLPAYILGRDPNASIIGTSYGAELASMMNRDVQRIIDSPDYSRIFPDTRLEGSNVRTIADGRYMRNNDIFEIVGHRGVYRSAGIGGGITGMGAQYAIIDDPIKNQKEAASDTYRQGVWEWYTSTLYTRLQKPGAVLLTLTRWHEDDLAGRLLQLAKDEPEADKWTVIRLPARCETINKHEDDKRNEGEALWESAFPSERLRAIKGSVGTRIWEALYQQNPTALGGNIFKGEWFHKYEVLPPIRYRKIFADTAQKIKEHNDYSVLQCWGLGSDGKAYLIDMIRGKWEAPELESRTISFWNKHADKDRYPALQFGQLRQLVVEDKASGTGLIQKIKLLNHIPIHGVERVIDKLTRVMDILGYAESGLVCLPLGAPFTSDFITECEAFTADDSHAHDDQIDPMIDAINDMVASGNKLRLWENII